MPTTAESLLHEGSIARREDRYEDAKKVYTEVIEFCQFQKDAITLAIALRRLGGIERDLNNIPTALEKYKAALQIYQNLPPEKQDPLSQAHTIRHVGDILRESSQFAEAVPCYEEALSIYRNHPETDTLDLANTLRGYALLNAERGDKQASITLWQETGRLYNQVWQEPNSPYSQADLTPGIEESKRQIQQLQS